jgi:hypothetical protein
MVAEDGGWDCGAGYIFGDTHRDSAYARLREMLDSKVGVEGEGKS